MNNNNKNVYALQCGLITTLIVGCLRIGLKQFKKNSPLFQFYQVELLSGLIVSDLILWRMNSKELLKYQKLQLVRLNRSSRITFDKENMGLWTNSQYWH